MSLERPNLQKKSPARRGKSSLRQVHRRALANVQVGFYLLPALGLV
jgi:hypothetical protein